MARSTAATALKQEAKGTFTRTTINGAAVAEALLKTVAEQGTKLLSYLNDIVTMSTEARKEFRLTLKKHLDGTRDQIKKLKAECQALKAEGKVEEFKVKNGELELLSKGFDVAKVRISEASRFAEACDANYGDFNVGDGYHKSIAKARMFLQGAAAARNAAKNPAGRKMTPPEDAAVQMAIRYINTGKFTADDLIKAFKAAEKKVKGVTQSEDAKKEQDWKGKLTASNDPKPREIGPTQRHERRTRKSKKAEANAMTTAGILQDRRITHDAPPAKQ
jgi:hypothetical protein